MEYISAYWEYRRRSDVVVLTLKRRSHLFEIGLTCLQYFRIPQCNTQIFVDSLTQKRQKCALIRHNYNQIIQNHLNTVRFPVRFWFLQLTIFRLLLIMHSNLHLPCTELIIILYLLIICNANSCHHIVLFLMNVNWYNIFLKLDSTLKNTKKLKNTFMLCLHSYAEEFSRLPY